MRFAVLIVTVIVLGVSLIVAYAVPSEAGGRLALRAATAAPSPTGAPQLTPITSATVTAPGETTKVDGRGASDPTTATPSTPLASPTRRPRVILPPVFTPTSTPNVGNAATSATSPAPPKSPAAGVIPPATATSLPMPTATFTPKPPPPPTLTPTPSYDYIVANITEIPRPGNRDLSYIRGRLVDRNGQLIKGAKFEIRSDAFPPWTAVGPDGTADGTVVFVVSRGRFAVRVLGGRSQDAGWMKTGQTGVGPMSDFEFTFQATQ